MGNERFDICYGQYGPRIDFHFCREWDDEVGCYGTNPNHGYTWEEARKLITEWYEQEAKRWAVMAFEEWCPSFKSIGDEDA